MTDPVAVTASAIALARFLLEQVERHQNGDMTDEQLQAAWDALQVRRDVTKQLWTDAKQQGGFE